MRVRTVTIAITAVLLAACAGEPTVAPEARLVSPTAGSAAPSAPAPSPTTTVPTTDEASPTPTAVDSPTVVAPQTTVVATGLSVPWSVAFLPDGDALVSERATGRIVRLTGTEIVEVMTITVDDQGEGGLLGLAISPEHAQDGFVYAYHTTAEDNRIVRFTLEGGDPPEVILDGIPSGSIHNGGRLAFGPDGLLYAATGDAGSGDAAQDLDSLGGKILRLEPDGGVPDDNPFPGSPVYSYGHRNVQGLAFAADGQLLATEFGQNTFDEVNRIEAGANYGWPLVEGEGGAGEFVDPITTWTTAESSPSGVAILVDGAIPQWEGDLFVAALRGRRLWRLDLDDQAAVLDREVLLEGEFGRLRDAVQAPDGSLWVLTSNRDGRGDPGPEDDRIIRIGP